MAIPSRRPDSNAPCHLPAVATAVAPTYNEGDAVPLSTDLNGQLRASGTGGGGAGDASAAKQDQQTALLTTIDTDTGNIASVQGATTDAAVTTNTTGSISGKLRGLVAILADVWDSVNHYLKVSIQNSTLAVTQSGTWTVQPGNTANTTAWKVDGSAVTQPVSGTFWQATQPVSMATNTPVGNVAHDGVDSGAPIKVGLKAETSPKGITLVSDGDRTDAYADADGMQMVKLNTSGADLISERVSNTDGASTAFTNFSAVASTKNYITAFSVFRTDAGTTPIYVDFRDGTAGSILWSAVIPPNGGANNPPYNGPALFKTSAATALAYDVSAATTTVYISVSGYQSKV